MLVSFSQEIFLPVGPTESWKFLMHAFAKYSEVAQWPRSLVSLSSPSHQPIAEEQLIQAIYRVGPLHREVLYRVSKLQAGHKIAYQTTDQHPLQGKSEITLHRILTGTRCHWHGYYQSKGFFSRLPLLWFKFYYENAFFTQLKYQVKSLRHRPKARIA